MRKIFWSRKIGGDADKLSLVLGQSVVVEDRPGADGALTALYVHHQPADGTP